MSFGVNSFGVTSYGTVADSSTGIITHTTSGGLISANSLLSGNSTRSGAVVTHTTTGALEASVATIVGSSARGVYTKRIAIIGDSNASGRGSFNQTAPASGADLYNNAGSIVALSDPWDSDGFGGVLDDAASVGGSYVPNLAQRYVNAGKTTLWIPANKGGSKASDWAVGGAMYNAMKARIQAAGGVDAILIHLGANDAISGVSQATFTSQINAIVSGLISDFNCAVYLEKVHVFTGYTAQCAVIRAAVDDVWNGSSGCLRGADLGGITSNIHYGATGVVGTCTSELNAVAALIYSSIEAITHATSGQLSAQVSNMSGTSSVTIAPVTHTTTGSLLSQTSSMFARAVRPAGVTIAKGQPTVSISMRMGI